MTYTNLTKGTIKVTEEEIQEELKWLRNIIQEMNVDTETKSFYNAAKELAELSKQKNILEKEKQERQSLILGLKAQCREQKQKNTQYTKLLREMNHYLDYNEKTNIGHDSLFHRQIKKIIK